MVSIACLFLLNSFFEPHYDFNSFWGAGRALLQGQNPYDYEVIKDILEPRATANFNYPLFIAVLVVPLGFFDLETAKNIWLTVSEVLLLASIYLSSRSVPSHQEPGPVHHLLCSLRAHADRLVRSADIDVRALSSIPGQLRFAEETTGTGRGSLGDELDQAPDDGSPAGGNYLPTREAGACCLRRDTGGVAGNRLRADAGLAGSLVGQRQLDNAGSGQSCAHDLGTLLVPVLSVLARRCSASRAPGYGAAQH